MLKKSTNNKNITILGIETSCDETAAAIYSTKEKIKSNIIYSQIDLHKEFGGVIPEVASRSHLQKIKPIVKKALSTAQTSLDDINAIAVTHKPGLPGSLLVGLSFAKALSYAKNIPLIGVNHLEGHAFSACIENKIPFPFLCLTASGGHTALYLVEDYGQYTTLGQTLDDAAGEAFDKVAKLLNLDYPGGPIIEKLAKEANFQDFFNYPRAMKHSLDFSFSGIKTAVLYGLVDQQAYNLKNKCFLEPDNKSLIKQVSSSLLVCIADIFEQKILLALKKYHNIKAISFVGGVACNKYIRNRIDILARNKKLPFFVPHPEFCTDNAAMIAFVGHYKALKHEFSDLTLDIF